MTLYYFYKIQICNTDYCYVGSTTNLSRRIADHKATVDNYLKHNYNYTLYKTIRENGGWINVRVIVISADSYETKNDALLKEQEYIISHKANLNMKPATSFTLTELTNKINTTARDSDENKLKRVRTQTALWKKTTGKEKYNAWQREYMRKKQYYNRQATILRYCLLPDEQEAI